MEKWKPVVGFDNYEVSNFGCVRRIPGFNSRGRKWKGKILSQTLQGDKRNYPGVILYIKGKAYSRRVHRLVAEAFLPNVENLPAINHKDGITTNNSVENLEWCTNQENINHAISMGLKNTDGINNGRSKINEDIVRCIRYLSHKGESNRKLSKMFGISDTMISYIVHRKNWKHVV